MMTRSLFIVAALLACLAGRAAATAADGLPPLTGVSAVNPPIWMNTSNGVAPTTNQVSSVTYCSIPVSTFTATRLDNFNGLCEGSLPMLGRTTVKLCNKTGNTTIKFGFSVAVSTQDGNTREGEEVVAGACKEIGALTTIKIYGLSNSASAAQNLNIEQAAP